MKRASIHMVGLFFWMVLSALPAAEAKQQWKFTNTVPADQIYTEYFNRLAENITKATNGEVEVTNYPAGELPYKGTDLLKVTSKGLIEMAEVVAGFVSGEAPLLALLDLPYVALNEQERETFLKIAYPVIEEELRSRGVEPLGVVWYGPRQIVSRKPTYNLDDLKGQKVRTGGGLQEAYIELWGGVPTFVVWAEVYPAAQRGIVDAVMTATLAIQQSKVYEVCPYFFKIDGPLMHQYICVNQKAWQSVSQDNKDAIRLIVDEWTDFWIRKVGYELDAAALQGMHGKGQIKNIAELPTEDRLRTREQLLPQLKEYVQKHMQPKGPEVFAKVLKALEIE